MKNTYSRGQLSKVSGVNAETIRFYEGKGLLPIPARTEGGHRIYDDSHLQQLRFIHRCRDLGFNLQTVSELIALSKKDLNTCHSVKELTSKHIKDIQQKISDLKKMEKSLKQLVTHCDDSSERCQMIKVLFS